MTVSWCLPWILVLCLACFTSFTQAELVQFSDVTIECEPGGVEITLNTTALEDVLPNLDPDNVGIGPTPWPDTCQPTVHDTWQHDMKVFKFSYGDCHPYVEELTDTKLRLIYEIVGDRKVKSEDTPRGTAVGCIVAKDGLISAKISQNTNIYKYVGSAAGEYRFGMTIFKDPFMSVPVENDEEIPLGTPLWVGMKMNSTDNAEMYVKDCWATPTPTKTTDQTEHLFIRNGVIAEDDDTFTPVDDIITATTYGFSFDSFMFRGAGSRVYIKCNIHACDPTLTDSYKHVCAIPKYPEFEVNRDLGELGSGSGSGFGLSVESRDLLEDHDAALEEDEEEEEEGEGNTEVEEGEEGKMIEKKEIVQKEFPMFYVMHSFKVKHMERKRRSTGSYRIYPRHTMFSNLRSGITLGIIIASTAMISACAILLPLHLSGEKVRCLHVKPVKRVV